MLNFLEKPKCSTFCKSLNAQLVGKVKMLKFLEKSKCSTKKTKTKKHSLQLNPTDRVWKSLNVQILTTKPKQMSRHLKI